MCAPDTPVQSLLFQASVRARGRFQPGARGHLGALRAPVGARQCCAGYRLSFPAELAGLWEVKGRRSGAKTAEPEVVPQLAKGFLDLQQAGADTAPVVPAERLQPDLLPRVLGENPVVVEDGDEVLPRRAGVPPG